MKLQIVKIGSNSITLEEKENSHFEGIGNIDEKAFSDFVVGIVDNYKNGFMSLLVSSGAVAVGRAYLGIAKEAIADKKNPKCVRLRQACAAAGQPLLMQKYIEEFAKYKIKVAQILVTHETFSDQNQLLSLFETMKLLLAQGVVPIINENDVLSSTEIKFSDNDKLAMLIVENMRMIGMSIEKLILLTNVEGFFNGNPKRGAKIVPRVSKITDTIYAMVQKDTSESGTGGFASKIEVAERMLELAIPMYIASGKDDQVLQNIARGDSIGTVFAK